MMYLLERNKLMYFWYFFFLKLRNETVKVGVFMCVSLVSAHKHVNICDMFFLCVFLGFRQESLGFTNSA